MTGTIQLRGNSRSSLVEATRSQLATASQSPASAHARARRARSLVAGDVEGNGGQHHLGSHALDGAADGQVQLAGEGEVRGGAQVSQRLQRLDTTRGQS